MKVGVVIFPGSNCDQDLIHVFKNVMQCEVEELWHKDHSLGSLSNHDLVVLPGGFSYGDYLRSGAIARFSPIMDEVKQHAESGGLVIGICNGFQILCESHLLPGALTRNRDQLFICKNIYLKVEHTNSRFTQGQPTDRALKIPISHAEGRYVADDATIKSLEDNNQILYRYCNEAGEVTSASNPNGSIHNIAGICNKAGNVFGMMPHPDRCAEEALGNTDGLLFFQSVLQHTEQFAV